MIGAEHVLLSARMAVESRGGHGCRRRVAAEQRRVSAHVVLANQLLLMADRVLRIQQRMMMQLVIVQLVVEAHRA